MKAGSNARASCAVVVIAAMWASAQAQSPQAAPVDTGEKITFRGWGDADTELSAGVMSFTGWGTPATEYDVGTMAFMGLGLTGSLATVEMRFTGWNQHVDGTHQRVIAFTGWNQYVSPAPQTLTFTGLDGQPPLCAPADLLEGRGFALPRQGDNGNLYQVFTCETDWHTAEANCASAGAHLMTITSPHEQEIAAEIAPLCGHCWLGLTDSASEGNFTWITGEPLGYANWAGGEPNDHCEDGEDYVHLHPGGEWNDQQADGGCNGWGLMGYICEWERN